MPPKTDWSSAYTILILLKHICPVFATDLLKLINLNRFFGIFLYALAVSRLSKAVNDKPRDLPRHYILYIVDDLYNAFGDMHKFVLVFYTVRQ